MIELMGVRYNARVFYFKGPGPHRTTNRLLSNGHKGVVTCVLTEDDGTQSKRLFYFDEPRV